MAAPHPDFARLAARCAQLANGAAKPWEGVGFRFASLPYAQSNDLLSGRGAKKCGGRINGIGTFLVVYTSSDPLTAAAETYQSFASFGFSKEALHPMLIVAIEIKLAAVLDLCDLRIRRQLKVTLKDLAQPWWPVQEAGGEALTQAIGRAAFDAGFEAVILPSARRRAGSNLNIFPAKLRPGSSITVLAEGDLKRFLH